ncbi:MAG: 50S ribosomal protein L32 [Dehalococcoidia bacterium]
MPPLPKKKTSTSRRRRRRSHLSVLMPALMACPQCRSPRQPHHACPVCGTYRGRDVIAQDTHAPETPGST